MAQRTSILSRIRQCLWRSVLAGAIAFAFCAPSFLTATSLQERIDAASPGSVLPVPPGTHPGRLLIDKPLTLRGTPDADGNLPHIRGDSAGRTIEITAPDVTVENLRISHSGLNLSKDDAAIFIAGDGATIRNNRIHDSLHGIYVRGANNTRITGNQIRGVEETAIPGIGLAAPGAIDSTLCAVNQDRRGNGIHFWNSSGHLVSGNEISETRDGIYFSFTTDSRIEDNRVYETRYGLHYMYSDRNYLSNNLFENNVAGAALMFSKDVAAHQNTFTRNEGSRAYGLLLHNVDTSVIRDNRIVGNRTGLYLQGCHSNEARDNLITRNFIGMRLTSSSMNNVFHRNRFGLNLHPINLARGENRNDWHKDGRGNFWINATELDVNGDGVSEIPHRETDLLGDSRENFPLISLLTESPALHAIQFALRRAPVPETPHITDRHPLTHASRQRAPSSQ